MRFLVYLPLLLCTLLAQAQTTVPDDYQSLSRAAYALYEQGDFEASANAYVQLFEAADFSTASDRYNASCSFALAGNAEKAMEQLTLAAEMGWRNPDHTLNDTDLASLHEHPQWQQLINKIEENYTQYAAQFDSGLRKKLMQVMADDQRYRAEIVEKGRQFGWQSEEVMILWKKQSPLDSVNTIIITQLLDSLGYYPGKSLVGPDLAGASFLVIQHAEHETQKHYLPMLKQAAEAGEMPKSSLALLIDRIRIRDGEPQLYGSQVNTRTASGKQEFYPIEDEANVNKRRAAMDLPPLEEYAKRMGVEYSQPQE